MEKLLKYLFVLLLAIILVVKQSNANAINECKIDGNECNSDFECCNRSCISNDGINHFCAYNTEEIKCLSHGEDCTFGNITCCHQCRINWARAFCT